MKPRLKAIVPAVAVSGGVAALLFGGTAVSTAFTSRSSYNANFVAAKVNGTVTGGSFSVTGLTPGGPAAPVGITFNNTGTTTEEAYVQLGALVVNAGGTGGVPVAGDLQFTLELPTGTYPGGTASSSLVVSSRSGADSSLTAPAGTSFYTFNFSELSAVSGTWLDAGTIGAGQSVNETVWVNLATGTGNSWNGANVTLPYTVQFQDTSGVNQGIGGSVKNLNGAQQVDDNHYVAPTNG